MKIGNIRIALLQGLIVLAPTYAVAFFTEKMVYTIPMLAAAGFVAASLRGDKVERKVDEDGFKKGEIAKDDGSS
jgi:hypothetical protein